MKKQKAEINFPTPLELLTKFIEKKKTEVKSKEALKVLEECGSYSADLILNDAEKNAFIGYALTLFHAVFQANGTPMNESGVERITEIAEVIFDEMFNIKTLWKEHIDNITKSN